MYTITTSILASCLTLLLLCLFGLADSELLDILVFWDLIFVPFLVAAAIGSVIGFAIAKLLGLMMPFVAEVTETVQLSFVRDEQLGEADFYCITSDLASGKNAFHVFTISDNSLKLVKSLWANKTTEVVEDDTLSDGAIWKKTRLIPDPSSRLYRWALAQPKGCRNELHLPPEMVQH